MDVEVKEMPAMRVAFIRHIGPYGAPTMADTWERLCDWAGVRDLFGAETRCLGICHDDPEITPPEKIRYDACLTVGPEAEGEGEVGIAETAPGRYAVTLHAGPYEALGATYARLCGEWLPAHGYEMCDEPAYEIYLNTPDQTPPEELLTEIYIPVEKA